MKKILSIVAVFALSLSLNVANAQDKPKTASTDKAKTECSSHKSCSDKAKVNCGTSTSTKAMKASHKSGDGCCDHGAKKAKMASKDACGDKCDDKCGDDCKMAHKMSKSDSNKN